MPSQTSLIYLQPFIVNSSSSAIFETKLVNGTYEATQLGPSSTDLSEVSTIPEFEGVIVKAFASVPVVEQSELRTEYQELGLALSEMKELDNDEDFRIEPPVYAAACIVAVDLMAHAFPPPQVFSHGPKSVVFNWSKNSNNLYLTISADKISALVSTPEKIQRRLEIEYPKLQEKIHELFALANGDEDYQRTRFLLPAISDDIPFSV